MALITLSLQGLSRATDARGACHQGTQAHQGDAEDGVRLWRSAYVPDYPVQYPPEECYF